MYNGLTDKGLLCARGGVNGHLVHASSLLWLQRLWLSEEGRITCSGEQLMAHALFPCADICSEHVYARRPAADAVGGNQKCA